MIELPPELTIQIHRSVIGTAIATVVVGLVLLYTLSYFLFTRRVAVARDFALLLGACFLYIGGYTFYASSRQVAAVGFWTRICYTGVALLPFTLHLLLQSITTHRHKKTTLAIGMFCLLMVGLVWIADSSLITHQLKPLAPNGHPTMVKGPAFPAFVALTYVLIGGIFALFTTYFIQHPEFQSVGRPFIVSFVIWALSSIYDSFVALGLIDAAAAQPWIGPVFMIFTVGRYVNKKIDERHHTLQRRVEELKSLHAVGQALSISLDVETIMWTIYSQVSRLMPTETFYVALYNPQIGEISFPLFVEDDRQRQEPSRRFGNGLTEFVLRSKEPLLIRQDLDATLEALHVDQIGRKAVCWLGVPIMAGNEALGIISVQSLTDPGIYNHSHQEILTTIAAQAAVAIQNARLYTRTDAALTRRLQELDSVLRTTHDGVLLLDSHGYVLTVNRALTDLLGLAQGEWIGQNLNAPLRRTPGPSLLAQAGYSSAKLQTDCHDLRLGKSEYKKEILHLTEPAERILERTLTPVRDSKGAITGWLMIFRDVTEQHNVEGLRKELTNMLIHDLRSPISVLQSSLNIMEYQVQQAIYDDLPKLIALASKGSTRVLGLIDQLLDISKIEKGQMPINHQPLDVPTLLEEVAARLSPMAAEAQISIEVSVPVDLPKLSADPDLINRALHNLLDNAIKFSTNGSHVRLWAELDTDTLTPAILMGVSDNGPGIPQDAQDKIFEKFRQIPGRRGRRRGTGLGLTLCKLVAEAHGGSISLESEEGEGATFILCIPVAPELPPKQIDMDASG